MIRTIQHYPHGACIVQGIHPYSGETGLYLMGYMPPHYPVPAIPVRHSWLWRWVSVSHEQSELRLCLRRMCGWSKYAKREYVMSNITPTQRIDRLHNGNIYNW